MIERTKPLWHGFNESSKKFPDRPAIHVTREVTYLELADRAKRLASTIQKRQPGNAVPLTAVFGYRSETAYAGVLAALMAGHGYVPLNRTFPIARSRLMLARSRCASMLVDAGSEAQLDGVLEGINTSLLLIFPDRSEVADLAAKFPAHDVVGANDLDAAKQWQSVDVPLDSIAYLLFTSGSTGEPKGVMVSHGNVRHYVKYVSKRYNFSSDDRVSQTFDLTFDLSAHDMFVAWENGACVCCPTQKQAIKPGAFINDARLSVWFSVPSTAIFMRRLGMLKPDLYPRLCGEALPAEIARRWTLAASTR